MQLSVACGSNQGRKRLEVSVEITGGLNAYGTYMPKVLGVAMNGIGASSEAGIPVSPTRGGQRESGDVRETVSGSPGTHTHDVSKVCLPPCGRLPMRVVRCERTPRAGIQDGCSVTAVSNTRRRSVEEDPLACLRFSRVPGKERRWMTFEDHRYSSWTR